MRLKKVLCVSLWMVLLAGCSEAYEWNQKLTVVISTPNGDVTGSSVTHVEKVLSEGFFTLPEARGVYSGVSGEAVVVEVTEGQYLFVLLDGVDDLAYAAFPQFPYERTSEFGTWARSIERHRGAGVVPPDEYPMMVTFEDISDPTSARLVEPDNLAASFGQGVELMEMTLEITEEQVTTGRIIAMPFWPTLVDQITFSGLDRFDPASPDSINYTTFKSLLQE